jgi:endo-1,4-beta-xylanase
MNAPTPCVTGSRFERVALALLLATTTAVFSGAQNAPSSPTHLIPAAAAAANAAAQAAGLPPPPMPLLANAPVLALWAPGSAGFNPRALSAPETYKLTDNVPERVEKVYGITNPSIEIHRVPPDINTGAAIILAPGGGNTELNVATEGTDMVPFFYNLGVNTIILRYSLGGTGGNANADAIQAIRMVRAHAAEWGLDPKKIGLAGFSAGGERVAHVITHFDAGDPAAADPVARASSRPDFMLDVYGSGNVAAAPRNAPPTFITVAGQDDAGHAAPSLALASALLAAGAAQVEIHMYGHGGHANGMKDRNGIPFGTWQDRFVDWFRDLGFLGRPGTPTNYNLGAFSQQAAAVIAAAGRGGRRGGRGAPAPAPGTPAPGTP